MNHSGKLKYYRNVKYLAKRAASGDVKHVCSVRRALRPSSVPLHPPVQVKASPLLFRLVP